MRDRLHAISMKALHWRGVGPGTRRLRIVGSTVLCFVLVWKIVTTNFATHLVDVAPRVALFLASSNPSVLLELADRKVNPGIGSSDLGRRSDQADASRPYFGGAPAFKSRSERDEVRAWAETALTQSPFDSRALRILGQLALEASAATRFMEAAARRSLNETEAHYWLLQRRFAQHRYADVIRAADILLRTRPQLLEFVAPFLARMAEDRSAVGELEQAIKRNPPWRDAFLNYAPEVVTDVRAPLRLMLTLKNTPFPASAENQRAYLSYLFQRRSYDFAYYAWRQLLPPDRSREAGILYNSDFNRPPSGLPFDWLIAKGSGVTIDIVPHPDHDKSHAIVIDYGQGRAGPHSVVEFVKLTAGSYRMIGRFRGELVGRRGLRWRVACVESNITIGESEMAIGRFPDWKLFQFDFVAPEKDCPLQSIRLELDARSASEWMASGKMWYADLKIEPIGASARSSK